MKSKDRNMCFIGFILVVSLWISVECNKRWYKMSESFAILREPGVYPAAVTTPILYGDYPISST